MGFFSSLFGVDQSLGAVNAVLASHLIENANSMDRLKIAREALNIITRGKDLEESQLNLILKDISSQSRVVQMNFIALACDNLYIQPLIPNNVWTRVENPYRIGEQVDLQRIEAAIEAIHKQDKVKVNWPGDNIKLDFRKMCVTGQLK